MLDVKVVVNACTRWSSACHQKIRVHARKHYVSHATIIMDAMRTTSGQGSPIVIVDGRSGQVGHERPCRHLRSAPHTIASHSGEPELGYLWDMPRFKFDSPPRTADLSSKSAYYRTIGSLPGPFPINDGLPGCLESGNNLRILTYQMCLRSDHPRMS